MKDYCSYFPDVFRKQDIGNSCCKKHDNDSGEKGDFNFIRHQVDFYKCLQSKLSLKWAVLITIGGTLGVLIKLPWLVFTKVRYRMKGKQ